MQYRMKTHPLEHSQIERLLQTSQTAVIATLNQDGTPYAVPIHFVYQNGTVFFHGLPKGQKIENLRANPAVSLTVYEMQSLLLDPDGRPCETNTQYESVVLSGNAFIVEDLVQKQAALKAIVQKYTPQLSGSPLPEPMVRGTAVVRIDVTACTGKYYS